MSPISPTPKKKLISVVSGCYNEEQNVEVLYSRIRKVFDALADYDFELILIDNCSKDHTVEVLRRIAARDKRLKVIVNARNFGVNRSGTHALYQASGDAIVAMASDLQDPPELIPQFIQKWEQGFKLVVAIKAKSKEGPIMFLLRRIYYKMLASLSENVDQIQNFTGFGLYDKVVLNELKRMKDPVPYVRGMLSEIGFSRAEIPFTQPRRERGVTSNNFFTLLDFAIVGLVNYTKAPIRFTTLFGVVTALFSFAMAAMYLLYKLLYWNSFQLGTAPLVIGLFFIAGVQLISIGVLGEYVSAIYSHVKNRPLVVEAERINFD